MRLHVLAFAVSAAAAAANYYNDAICRSSLDCLRICKHGDFKVYQDSAGQPQLECAEGIIEYSRKTCLSRNGRGDENIKLLGGACVGARGLICENYCVVPTTMTMLEGRRFEDECRALQGIPSTIVGGLTEDQAKGQESCSWSIETR
ncbi:hypothetical protein MY4038_005206 [Beauveria bassiana]|uniref:Uncharacterized protein n=1 Tax=Beauveria bassiana (strain ARSEF 2860) TaxID=655819 RepID=J4W2Z1_BEAB2|nr:uncharacterized protein BBA_06364 [Beauveria bassiana ARSEF 2860]EJP64795.1 hypothetical protein BBA_06364 [Beauveria bassiana ARSEF 2860]KAF1733369.1 hypothetical protein CRV24_007269 [Beauveria bassiana]KAH8712557.1 hypothetical protein HC256_005743 [Beauveria bassiana]